MVTTSSTVQAASAAAMAGTVRRISAPANTPMAKAARVQAAKSTPRRSNSCGANWPSWPCGEERLEVPGEQQAEASAAAVTAAASSASLAIVQRARPQPWVQANRNVPVSSSRASSGAAGEHAEQHRDDQQQDRARSGRRARGHC